MRRKAQEAQPAAEPGQETPEPTATEKEPDKDTFSIYQLKDGDGMRDYHFEPYDRLQAVGLSVEAANYDLIYTAELTPGTSLEDIYTVSISTTRKILRDTAFPYRISERQVQKLCEENRIPGVAKFSRMWLIPKDAEKPTDKRRKNFKSTQ